MKLFIVIGGIVVLVIAMFIGATAGMGEVRNLVVNDVDLAGMADGVYTGLYHKSRWSYDMEVTVVDHKITVIKNTNPKTKMQKGFNDKAAEAIIKKQSPKVDAVAGATISSKAFSKAVENALESGLKK